MAGVREGVLAVVGIAVALFVAAYILPTALTTLATAAMTSVNAGVTTIFQVLLPIIAIIAIAMYFLREVK